MSWYDWLGYALLAIAAISFVVMFPLVLRTNLINGHAYREKLAVAIN